MRVVIAWRCAEIIMRLHQPKTSEASDGKPTPTHNTISRCHGRGRRAFFASLILTNLSACAAKNIVPADLNGYVADTGQRVAQVDWNTAKTVDIVLLEYKFTPSSLHFRRDVPYRLHLSNAGIEVHDFASKPFFQAIAAAKLVDAQQTIALPHLVSIGIDPGKAKDLYFVPVRPGSYSFECSEPLHSTFGMTGTAEIE
jgi:uncharacterized cupredoxin-like copper-binding protein